MQIVECPNPNYLIDNLKFLDRGPAQLLLAGSSIAKLILQHTTHKPGSHAMADDAQSSPFIKHLASSDKRTRDSALASLRAFLASRSEISELDLLKLWKGLFYCTSNLS